MSAKVTSIRFDFPSNNTTTVHLNIDQSLSLSVKIQNPDGAPEDWTIGRIKQLAIEAANSKIPNK